MLRLDPNNLPPHLQAQIHKKLGQWQERSQVELKPQKHEMVIAPKKVKPTKEMVDVCGCRISTIHAKLWHAVSHIEGSVLEFKGAIPKRRFSLDIAFPELKIAVEVDGWQYHGKYKESHTKDRERQNLLTLHGWRILRYTAKQINQELEQCVQEIQQLVELVNGRKI